jgi:uncharacterized membrane protein YqhA
MPGGQVVVSIASVHVISQTLTPPNVAMAQVYWVALGCRPAQSELVVHTWLQKPMPGGSGE